MTRATVIWVLLVLLAGGVLLTMKQRVGDLEDELLALDERLVARREAIHVLEAEWSYLTRPARLAVLAERHLDLAPVRPEQFITPDMLPGGRPAQLALEPGND